MSGLGEALYGGPSNLPASELTQIYSFLAQINIRLNISGAQFTIFTMMANGACVAAAERRAEYLWPVVRLNPQWYITSYSFLGTSVPGVSHTFNLLVYRASDGNEYKWTVDNYLGIPAIDFKGTDLPWLSYPTKDNHTFYGDGRIISIS